jgi:23S rRNA pseudouridine2604 synthase
MEEKVIYPIRINRYLAKKQICTRREADGLISAGKVEINGRKAVLGDKIGEKDEVLVRDDPRRSKNFIYLAYNKPRGIITHSAQKGEKEIGAIINYPVQLFPVGRLDKDSSGLIILTNDGRITDRMLNPEYCHEKEYVVGIDKKITPSFVKNMSEGIMIGDYKTKKCKVEKMGDFNFSIRLTEGKKHQIRRMCEALGKIVLKLKRVRIMNIELRGLKAGQFRKIENEELDGFLREVGIISMK